MTGSGRTSYVLCSDPQHFLCILFRWTKRLNCRYNGIYSSVNHERCRWILFKRLFPRVLPRWPKTLPACLKDVLYYYSMRLAHILRLVCCWSRHLSGGVYYHSPRPLLVSLQSRRSYIVYISVWSSVWCCFRVKYRRQRERERVLFLWVNSRCSDAWKLKEGQERHETRKLNI